MFLTFVITLLLKFRNNDELSDAVPGAFVLPGQTRWLSQLRMVREFWARITAVKQAVAALPNNETNDDLKDDLEELLMLAPIYRAYETTLGPLDEFVVEMQVNLSRKNHI